MSDKEKLLETLKDLTDEEFKEFKWYLQNPDILVGLPAIPKNQLENTDRPDTVDKITQAFSHQSVEVVKKVLKKIPRNDLVEKLSSTGPGTQGVFPGKQPEACSPPNTLLEARPSLQTPTPPQTTSPSASTLSAPSQPTTLHLNPPVDKAQNTSSKYDNITCKVLIQSGSPTLYLLKPKEEKIGTLKRMTLGEKYPDKINKTILLVGETGAGKSTLINALVNNAMGVEWEDDVWFKIVEEEEKKISKAGTQTSDVIVYQIFDFEDKLSSYSLTIIDTPGYGDTRGTEHDAKISERLLDLLQSDNGVHEINAVGLVMKASVTKLCDRQKYILDSVMSLFGKDLEKNIVTLITHSNGVTPVNALQVLEAGMIKCARDEKNQPVHFLFDNSQDDDRTENIRALKHANATSIKGMNQFTNFLVKTAPQKLEITKHVLKEQISLTTCIQNLEERIKLIDLKKTEIQQTQDGLKMYEEEMKNNEKFTIEVDEVYKVKERIDGGKWGLGFYDRAVCCTVCEENCHYPGCTLARYPGHCEVMKDGRCTSCTRKCPVSDHVKEKWKYVNKTRKVKKTLADLKKDVQHKAESEGKLNLLEVLEKIMAELPQENHQKAKKTLEDVKEKYEKIKAETEKKESLLGTLQKVMETLEAKKTALLDEAYQHVVKLEQIALNVLSLSTYVHLDFLIEEMEKRKDTEKVNHLKQLESGKDEKVQAGLQYMCRQLPQMFQKK
ncbi:uncharacterized protein LOC117959771 [Etheostoma cragini]|uniref:uncharacterized protein LOC117959771 n=1 Tax=Etheostoma cragini TaxID=417921 RepID=UPI00155F2B0B|nr:uncharacterized protein LOC117959771 [Etheostoma cragini]